nr:hypothetical protein GCM10020241_26440 [Streptoalloteichus tenebrarius]
MARGARAHLDRVLARYGVTFAGFLVLRGLAAGPVGNGELAARLDIEAPTLTRQVNRLVRAGLVERSVPDGDRRAVRLSLSERGGRLLGEVERAVAAGDAELAAPLDDEELATLHDLLGRIGAHVDRLGRRWGDVVSGGPGPAPPRP